VGSLIALQFDTALGTHPSIERLPLFPEIVNLHDLRMDQIRDKIPSPMKFSMNCRYIAKRSCITLIATSLANPSDPIW
jgi:hypothetical protein